MPGDGFLISSFTGSDENPLSDRVTGLAKSGRRTGMPPRG